MNGEAREALRDLLLRLSTKTVADAVLATMDVVASAGVVPAFGLGASSGGAVLTWSNGPRDVVFTVDAAGGCSHTPYRLGDELADLYRPEPAVAR